MASISCKDIEKSFGQTKALRSVSLQVNEGELFCLLGPSGCGKTTLLRTLAGLAEADRGTVCIGGEDVTAKPAHLRGIGFVFQNYALWPHMTVADNVSYGPRLQKLHPASVQERLRRALEYVRLQGYEERFPDQLSGGQQQRVAVARALALEPKVMLFDEPLSNLDSRLRALIREQLLKLHQDLGYTIVYVTHDQGEALAMANRMALMDRGQVVQSGTPRELYFKPESRFAAEFLGTANLLPVRVTELHDDKVLTDGPLGPIELSRPAWLRAPGAALLCIRPGALAAAKDGPLRIVARLKRREFSGDIEQLLFEYKEFTLTAFSPGARTPLRPGEEALLSLDTEQLWLVPE